MEAQGAGALTPCCDSSPAPEVGQLAEARQLGAGRGAQHAGWLALVLVARCGGQQVQAHERRELA